MTAFNVVRFRVKPGAESDFIAAHQKGRPNFSGFRRFVMIKTGDRAYCVIAEWDNFESIVAARPGMIAMLDTFRHMLVDFGGELGVTDPVSGEAIIDQ